MDQSRFWVDGRYAITKFLWRSFYFLLIIFLSPIIFLEDVYYSLPA